VKHVDWFLAAASAAALLFGAPQVSYAQAPTAKERALEKRVQYLETRLERLESRLSAGEAGSSGGKGSKAGAGTPRSKPDASAKAESETTQGGTAATPPPPPQVGVGEAGDAPQELQVLRDNSVMLKPRGGEISTKVGYSPRKGFTQSDRSVLANTSVRYGVFDWLELGVNVPYGFSTRSSTLSPTRVVTKQIMDWGDVTVQANARVLEQTDTLPGTVVSLGAIFPTGPRPYDWTNYSLSTSGSGGVSASTPNPNDPFTAFFSRAAWGLKSNLQFYKTVDPIILFWGGGVDYLFSQHINGYNVQNGLRYNYNFGFSFAASEKTTLGFSINGSFQDNLLVNGSKVVGSIGEPIFARLSLIQRIGKDFFLEPSFSFGLNTYAPDYVIALGVRDRF